MRATCRSIWLGSVCLCASVREKIVFAGVCVCILEYSDIYVCMLSLAGE